VLNTEGMKVEAVKPVTALKKTRLSLGGIYGKPLASRGHARAKSIGRAAAPPGKGAMFTITPGVPLGRESPDSNQFGFTNLQDYFKAQREQQNGAANEKMSRNGHRPNNTHNFVADSLDQGGSLRSDNFKDSQSPKFGGIMGQITSGTVEV